MPPRKMPKLSESFDASSYGPVCPQVSVVGGNVVGDEDCLSLNVWVPEDAAGPLPVMVWVHGGGFTIGSGSEVTYEGVDLAREGVVVVTINYRLGPLGWLNHPAASAAAGRSDLGNQGLEDQRLAFAWVEENIAAFGGDPDNVTIFGESAGGLSVCSHLFAEASQPLFDRAIIQSGPCNGTLLTPAESAETGVALSEALSCDGDLACMQMASVETVMSALPTREGFVFGDGVSWQPSVDGTVLKTDVSAAIAVGNIADADVIVGANADEATLFVALAGKEFTREEVVETARANFGDDADKVLDFYDIDSFASPTDAFIQMVGDGFVCNSRALVRGLSGREEGTYLYHFAYQELESLFGPDLGAFHAAELSFVFRNQMPGTFFNKPEQMELSEKMQRYWTRFAATGDPNGGMDVEWPIYSDQTDQHLELDVEIAAGSDLRKETCDFFSSLE